MFTNNHQNVKTINVLLDSNFPLFGITACSIMIIVLYLYSCTVLV